MGWRLALFLLLLVVFFIPLSALPLDGLNWQALPILLAGLLAGFVLLALDDRSPGALGFYFHSKASLEGALGLGLGVLVAACTVLGIFTLGGIRWVQEPGSFSAYLVEGVRSLWFFTLPAAAEEVLFRGYLFQALAESWGGLKALWATSLAFGLIHLSNPNTSVIGIANIVVAGLFLGAVYLKTASLWWATGAHLGWNWALGFLADGQVSGLEVTDAPFYEVVRQGPDWISGGAFGPEGSILATLFLGGATYLVWKSPVIRPGRHAIDVRPLVLSAPGYVPGAHAAEGELEMGNTRRTT
jgi:membrane protease YdiL (CAAX protease family)